MHLYTLATQVPNVKEALPYATAVVLLATVLLVNATAIVVQPSATDAEAWSKALLVRGADDMRLLAKHGAQAIVQGEPDGPHCTARFRNLPAVCKVPRPAEASRRPRQAQERFGE